MKLNNKGQTLILFIALIPLIFMLSAFVIDNSVIIKETAKLNSITKIIISETINTEDYKEKIILLYKKNRINTDNIIINYSEDKLTIRNNYNIDSIFGGLVGIKKYKIKTAYVGYYENEKLIITKE